MRIFTTIGHQSLCFSRGLSAARIDRSRCVAALVAPQSFPVLGLVHAIA